ncbi:DgyrCDS11738 [Dimorphilus gyrociliatus]|uniref:Poly [ADP-ribose] polymerase n=1 Tax=Dimorphilus gyrociliatus TaxID=2664684 RepID=A0A7I8W5D2_9ANNE|nr:DgyrCDS11738 [Dimorphilus gyrociliatus]
METQRVLFLISDFEEKFDCLTLAKSWKKITIDFRRKFPESPLNMFYFLCEKLSTFETVMKTQGFGIEINCNVPEKKLPLLDNKLNSLIEDNTAGVVFDCNESELDKLKELENEFIRFKHSHEKQTQAFMETSKVLLIGVTKYVQEALEKLQNVIEADLPINKYSLKKYFIELKDKNLFDFLKDHYKDELDSFFYDTTYQFNENTLQIEYMGSEIMKKSFLIQLEIWKQNLYDTTLSYRLYNLFGYLGSAEGSQHLKNCDALINNVALKEKPLRSCGKLSKTFCTVFTEFQEKYNKAEDYDFFRLCQISKCLIFNTKIYHHRSEEDFNTFRQTFREVFEYCHKKGIRSIGIPPIGCGNLDYGLERVTDIFYEEMIQFMKKYPNSRLKKFVYTSLTNRPRFFEHFHNLMEKETMIKISAKSKETLDKIVGVLKSFINELYHVEYICLNEESDLNSFANLGNLYVKVTPWQNGSNNLKILTIAGIKNFVMQVSKTATAIVYKDVQLKGGVLWEHLKTEKDARKRIKLRMMLNDHTPPNWTILTGSLNNITGDEYKLIDLSNDNPNMFNIIKDFMNSIWNDPSPFQIISFTIDVTAIYQIENPQLIKLYGTKHKNYCMKILSNHHISYIETKSDKYLPNELKSLLTKEINEHYLFHGTDITAANSISENGFNHSIAKTGLLNTHITFAQDPKKSDISTSDNVRYILISRVILGDAFKTDESFESVSSPPCKVCSKALCTVHNEMYDSIFATHMEIAHSDHIVYDKDLCYPEFIISYKPKNENQISLKDAIEKPITWKDFDEAADPEEIGIKQFVDRSFDLTKEFLENAKEKPITWKDFDEETDPEERLEFMKDTWRDNENAIASLDDIEILGIERSENPRLYQPYSFEHKKFCESLSSDKFPMLSTKTSKHCPVELSSLLAPEINEFYFFHGTDAACKNNILEQGFGINEFYFFHGTNYPSKHEIFHQGFDFRLDGVGYYGMGAYFAEDPKKSDGYTFGRGTTIQEKYDLKRHIIIGRVILGNSTVVSRDLNLKRPPCKTCKANVCMDHNEYFDSVRGNEGLENTFWEYIVYSLTQCYPEYLVTYKLKQKENSP